MRRADAALGVLAALLVAGAAATDLLPPAGRPSPTRSAPAGLYERAVLCPPPTLRSGSRAGVAAAPASDVPTEVAVLPGRPQPTALGTDRSLVRPVTGAAPVEVVGYGGPVSAGVMERAAGDLGRLGEASGRGGAACAAAPATTWWFARGSSAAGAEEHVVVANPFPDEAVVDFAAIGPEGTEPLAQLSDVAVPAAGAARVNVSGAALPTDLLGIRIRAVRGRVVAWKGMLVTGDAGTPGYEYTLGAARPSTDWYFPEGQVGEGFKQTITVLNPTDRQALVALQLSTGSEVVQAPRLVEIPVPPGSVKRIPLAARLGGGLSELGGISVHLQSANGVPVVAESTLEVSGADLRGTATETGLRSLARRWVVPPAAPAPESDALTVFNPTGTPATVTVRLLSPDEPARSPTELRAVEVPAGLRVKLPLMAHTQGKPLVARVEASAPVAVARLSQQGEDIAAVTGIAPYGGG